MGVTVKDFDKVVEHLQRKPYGIIAIDGRDGSGKSHLSRLLNDVCGGTLLSEETYRSASLDGLFEFDNLKFMQDLAAALKSKPVIFESCFMQAVLKNLGLKPDIIIYIKAMSATTGEWNDIHEPEEESMKDEALKKETDFGKNIGIPPSNFRLQMISYHYDFKPQDTSDLVYERTEVYN